MKPSPPSRYRHVRHPEKFRGASLQTVRTLQPTLDSGRPVWFLFLVCRWSQTPRFGVRLPSLSGMTVRGPASLRASVSYSFVSVA